MRYIRKLISEFFYTVQLCEKFKKVILIIPHLFSPLLILFTDFNCNLLTRMVIYVIFLSCQI